MMTHFKQNDPRWKLKKIRGTNLLVNDYGCLICCVAMLSTYFGDNFGPVGAIDLTGFTPEGKMIWRSGNYKTFEFDKIVKGRDDDLIKKALKDPDRAVILGLNNAKHWVVATLFFDDLGTYEIMDPLDNTPSTSLRENDEISYMAFYKRKIEQN